MTSQKVSNWTSIRSEHRVHASSLGSLQPWQQFAALQETRKSAEGVARLQTAGYDQRPSFDGEEQVNDDILLPSDAGQGRGAVPFEPLPCHVLGIPLT